MKHFSTIALQLICMSCLLTLNLSAGNLLPQTDDTLLPRSGYPTLKPLSFRLNIAALSVGSIAAETEVRLSNRFTFCISGYVKPRYTSGDYYVKANGVNAELRIFPFNSRAGSKGWTTYFSLCGRYGYERNCLPTGGGFDGGSTSSSKFVEYIGLAPGIGWELNNGFPSWDFYIAPILAHYTVFNPENQGIPHNGLQGIRLGVCIGF